MSWSLRISNGDFVSSRGSYFDTVRNESKLIQDLRCYILEELGTDPYHPEYGSSIEQDPNIVGADFQRSTTGIDSELKRIVQDYQRRQVARARSDQISRGRVSLDQGEVLVSLESISFEQVQDHLKVNMKIRTGDENSFEFSIEL